jgi:hypothetical protein
MSYTFENVRAFRSVSPQSSTGGAINGTGYDASGFADGVAVVSVGATTGTPTSFTVNAKLQECATVDGTYTDITGASITAITAIDKQAEIKFARGVATLKFIRLVVTPAFVGGSTPTVIVGGTLMLGNATYSASGLNSVTAD